MAIHRSITITVQFDVRHSNGQRGEACSLVHTTSHTHNNRERAHHEPQTSSEIVKIMQRLNCHRAKFNSFRSATCSIASSIQDEVCSITMSIKQTMLGSATIKLQSGCRKHENIENIANQHSHTRTLQPMKNATRPVQCYFITVRNVIQQILPHRDVTHCIEVLQLNHSRCRLSSLDQINQCTCKRRQM